MDVIRCTKTFIEGEKEIGLKKKNVKDRMHGSSKELGVSTTFSRTN